MRSKRSVVPRYLAEAGKSMQRIEYTHASISIGFYIGQTDFLPGSGLLSSLRHNGGKGCFARAEE